jgi:hypothetical protein
MVTLFYIFVVVSVFCHAILLALPTKEAKGKDIVLRFIIEYSSLRDFCPQVK